ncbi:Ca2+-binding RTX toxin-like protein [Microvirga lupini]|uniref:Ca2+-binding RTX toxin-like protein n=1 Tax=Microvirga lupini TaxID=420324 RepID=A0A7W4VPK3_9HYPH|nr:calcium-binding protein [Microvirga lupini]MBB3020610.1 Ca2+-binding RTX toxin-like protein [Microvirga lupini]
MATRRPNKDGVAVGTAGSDKVYGDGRSNVLAGLGGNDSLWGRGGADIIDGGNGNDKLYGESGNDFLSGGLGRDTLVGGAGYDFFAFEKPSASNVDTVEDFNVKYDTIVLHKITFKVPVNSKGFMSSSAFWTGSSAHDSNDRIIYDNNTGALYYDPDGTGAKAAIKFAQLDANLKLTYKDFGGI